MVSSVKQNASMCAEAQVLEHLLTKYGPVLSHEDLRQLLRFPSAEAFDRYVARGCLGFELLQLPRRRGRFALASEVARFLYQEPSTSNRNSPSGSAADRRPLKT
jgi:hypothetical protein